MIKLKWIIVFIGTAVISTILGILIPESFSWRFAVAMAPVGTGFLLFVFSLMPNADEGK